MYGQQSAQPQVQQQPPQAQAQQQPPQQQLGFGSPTPTSVPGYADYTPGTQASSLGFASPLGQQFAAQNGAPAEPVEEPAPPPEPTAAPADPALFSMNVLHGQQQPLVSGDIQANGGQSMADQAYSKLVNMDAFDLVKDPAESTRNNPFDMGGGSGSSINNQMSLSDMKKTTNVRLSQHVCIVQKCDTNRFCSL
jgi:hypothetical protein